MSDINADAIIKKIVNDSKNPLRGVNLQELNMIMPMDSIMLHTKQEPQEMADILADFLIDSDTEAIKIVTLTINSLVNRMEIRSKQLLSDANKYQTDANLLKNIVQKVYLKTNQK